MPAQPLSDEVLQRAVDAFKEHGSQTKAAAALNMPRPTLQCQLERAAARGLMGTKPVLPGFEIKKISTTLGPNGDLKSESVQQGKISGAPFEPPGHFAIKAFSVNTSGDGRTTQKWTKYEAAKIDPAAFAAELKEHFANFELSQPPSPTPQLEYANRLNLFPISDPHFGLKTWAAEVGENWDLKIAASTYRRIFSEVVASAPATKEAIFLVGGDTLHADDNRNVTPRSNNHLQVDGRHPKVFLTACETLVEHINLLLTKHETVDCVILPGNHDETSAPPVAFFLYAWFRNEPRVTVDLSPSVHRFRLWGNVMFGFTHGHTCKFHKDFPGIMAAYEPRSWGQATHRVGHGFHVHHRSEAVSESGGVVTETHQVLCPSDAWHYGAGYRAGRAQQCIVYDREAGEVMRIRVPFIPNKAGGEA